MKVFNDQDLIAEYEKCERLRIVAEKFGCSDETVRRALIKNNIPRTKRHPKQTKGRGIGTEEAENILAEYYSSDVSIKALSKKYKRAPNSISRLLKEKGKGLKRCEWNEKKIDDDLLRNEAQTLNGYQIAKKYNICPSTIYKRAKRLGVEIEFGRTIRKWADRARFYGCDEKNIDISITIRKLRIRDKNICQICGKPVDDSDIENGHARSMYPTLDHIIPLSKGGTHTWNNVQLAHLGCNSSKCASVNFTV